MAFATGMFNRKVMQFPFPELRRKEDVEWLTSMMGKVKFGLVPEALYHVRKHPDRLTIPEV
jgi:hypothetical protein